MMLPGACWYCQVISGKDMLAGRSCVATAPGMTPLPTFSLPLIAWARNSLAFFTVLSIYFFIPG